MGCFNLIDEEWIMVYYADLNETKMVSLNTLFKDAHLIRHLAGDTKTQDFAILRVLLAILTTVYSRLDSNGEPYEFLDLDDRYAVKKAVDEDDAYDYCEALNTTWDDLWRRGRFDLTVINYLEKWHDRFFLLDDRYPFFQALAEDVDDKNLQKGSATSLRGKTLNRTISESNNKVALFSPKYDSNSNKDILTAAELARWLITFHGYTGLADKAMFYYGKTKYTASKGWLFDIGGVYIKGDNLFETLILNLILALDEDLSIIPQKPCWEYDAHTLISEMRRNNFPNNLSQLYTTWSRAIYIDPATNFENAFACSIVKLPCLEQDCRKMEPMTLWQFSKSGPNKNQFTPRKHRVSESLWRSFGTLAMPTTDEGEHRRPGIISYLNLKREIVGDREISVIAVSMQDDGNATSWVPTDEIYDELNINDYVLTDIRQKHWVPLLHDEIELTKKIINENYRLLLSDIADIRNIKENTKLGFINKRLEQMYFVVDKPFREWLSNIRPYESKDEKILEWRKKLRILVLEEAEKLLNEASYRDYLGKPKDKTVVNIITLYNQFYSRLNKNLNIGKEETR
jgi:CRISPR system Cascade subunit CasA